MSICAPCRGNFQLFNNHIKDMATEETYDNDDLLTIRCKFTLIGLAGNALTFSLQFIYRIFDLISFNFIRRGTEKAEHDFLVRLKTTPSLKGRAIPQSEITNACLKELMISIRKIVLLPLGFLAKEFICLFGLLFPYQGRKYFAKVDQFFYVRPLDMFKIESAVISFSNISAPCMQTSQFRKQENLFRFYDDTRDIESYNLEFEKLIQAGQEFYPIDLNGLNQYNIKNNLIINELKAAIALLKETLSTYAKTHEVDPEAVQKITNVLTKSA